MRYRVELSTQAQKQLSHFPRDVQARIERAIDEFEAKDDTHWSNMKALRGSQWKGRFRKRVGAHRIILLSGEPVAELFANQSTRGPTGF